MLRILVLAVLAAAYLLALLQPALIVYILLMAYSFTSQLFPAAIAALYSQRIAATAVICGLASAFGVALIFIAG